MRRQCLVLDQKGAIISEYLHSHTAVWVNLKILILSYKISIFAFTNIVLEQRYLEMISSLRNYFLLLCFFPCLDHCSYNITRAHNIMMYYVHICTIIWNTKIVLSSSLWTWQLQYTSGISKIGYNQEESKDCTFPAEMIIN